jgi:hypothetical protein
MTMTSSSSPARSDVDAALSGCLPRELLAAYELLAANPIPVEVFAAIHAAGAHTRSDRTGMHLANATEVLLVAVDTIPRLGDRFAGTLDSDPVPDLPNLDEHGLVDGTPAPPPGLPALRLLLWEWASVAAHDALLEQMTQDPAADGWADYPQHALLRDTFGADPRPWARHAVYAHQAVAAFHPYERAVDALAQLDMLRTDTAATVEVDTYTDLIDRARSGNQLPDHAAARHAVLEPARRALVHLVDQARDARTRWSSDSHPVGVLDSREVLPSTFDMLSSRISQTMRQLAPGQVAALARVALDQPGG